MKRSTLCWILLFVLALLPQPIFAGEKGNSAPELALVPADAAGFVHVRLADLWKSDYLKHWRETTLKVGDKILAEFDERFLPRPSSLDRLTVFVSNWDIGREAPIVILTTSKAIDKKAFAERSVPGAKEKKTPVGTLLVDPNNQMEIHFLDDKTLVLGPPGVVRKLLARPKVPEGNLREALKLAQAGKTVVAALNPETLPALAFRQVPPPFQPLLKAKLALLTLDLRQEGQLDFRAVYSGLQQATEAENAALAGVKLARMFLNKERKEMEAKVLGDGKPGHLHDLPDAAGSLYALSIINRVDDILAAPPMQKEGDALKVSLKLPQLGEGSVTAYAIATALSVPAIRKLREATARTQAMNNLKEMVLAMYHHHDAYKKFPPAAICDKKGKPLLSWRVAVLPYLEQNALYARFKLDEPWDSEHNRQLIPLMPAVYKHPSASLKPGETYYRVFVGGGAGFEWERGVQIREITDGTSNTLMIVEAADSVPWTKPDELVYDAKKPLPRFGNFHGDGTFLAAFFDGSVRFLRNDLPTLRALITRGGEDPWPADPLAPAKDSSSRPIPQKP